jgi:hypothetical protein
VNTYTAAIGVVRSLNVRDRKRDKRDDELFAGVRVPDCGFEKAIRVLENNFSVRKGEEAVA